MRKENKQSKSTKKGTLISKSFLPGNGIAPRAYEGLKFKKYRKQD